MLSTSMRRLVWAWTTLVLVFLYAPLLLVVLNAFNTSKTFAFPHRLHLEVVGRRLGQRRDVAVPGQPR